MQKIFHKKPKLDYYIIKQNNKLLHKCLSRLLSEIESDAELFEAILHTGCKYVILYSVFYMPVCLPDDRDCKSEKIKNLLMI
jgi:hypothetical protein